MNGRERRAGEKSFLGDWSVFFLGKKMKRNERKRRLTRKEDCGFQFLDNQAGAETGDRGSVSLGK